MGGFLQELADLGTVTSAEQLRANATATAARSMRYPVRLSAFAFELLMAFLKGARLFLPLGTINEHVNLQARGLSRLLIIGIRCSIMRNLASSSPGICWRLVKAFRRHSADLSVTYICFARLTVSPQGKLARVHCPCHCSFEQPLLHVNVDAPAQAKASRQFELAAMRCAGHGEGRR